MGIFRGSNSGLPRRAYYPSGPWIDGIKPAGYAEDCPGVARVDSPGNPNPDNYQLIKAHEDGEWLVVKMKYPDCTNFEGDKVLIFKNLTLLQLVNQKFIDPHFFPDDSKHKSPVARFVPTDEGWEMALLFVTTMSKNSARPSS